MNAGGIEVTEKIVLDNIAPPTGTYSHAAKVSAKNLIFVAGQIPIDKDGKFVGIDPSDPRRNPIDLEAQIRQTMLNLKAVLEKSGASLNDIVRLDTYVVASAMNEYKGIGRKVKREMLGGAEPPGATVFVAGLMMTHSLIEISAIAAIG
jgi:2-iminobutanoate/2-iminopropanoate deaminase